MFFQVRKSRRLLEGGGARHDRFMFPPMALRDSAVYLFTNAAGKMQSVRLGVLFGDQQAKKPPRHPSPTVIVD